MPSATPFLRRTPSIDRRWLSPPDRRSGGGSRLRPGPA
jgi:hypothetical protein